MSSASLSPSLCLAIVAALTLLSQAEDYCKSNLCPSGVVHVACGHKGNFASTCSKNATLIPLNATTQAAMVDAHNAVRQEWASGGGHVSSTACRMATISWNFELARLAELNVKKCASQHDDCHNTERFAHSGQNIYEIGYSGMQALDVVPILQLAVFNWAAEGAYVTKDFLHAYPKDHSEPEIGHFTVLVNEKNVAVGCAVANYVEDIFNVFLVTCNYATTNIIGQPVYTECPQKKASGCSSSNSKFSALCAANEHYDI